MKVAGINQLAPARFIQPLPKGLLADGWPSVSGKLRAPLFFGVTTALCALAVLLLSVLLIGGLDRLGVAPQYSFLGLNLTLIACCLLLLFSPLRARIRHSSRATQEAGAASAAVKRMGAEPVGKLLIIRRHKLITPIQIKVCVLCGNPHAVRVSAIAPCAPLLRAGFCNTHNGSER